MTTFGRAKEDRPTPREVVCPVSKSLKPTRVLICSVQLESLYGLASHFHGTVDLWLRLSLYWHDHYAKELYA
jgi:hypothetical protein